VHGIVRPIPGIDPRKLQWIKLDRGKSHDQIRMSKRLAFSVLKVLARLLNLIVRANQKCNFAPVFVAHSKNIFTILTPSSFPGKSLVHVLGAYL
jgi:hypothetical protein